VVLTAAWVALCALAGWLLRRRPIVIVAVAIVIWSLVPAVAAYRFTGLTVRSPIGFHPATWFALVALAIQLLTRPQALGRAVARHPFVGVALGMFVVGAALTSVLSDTGGSRLLADQIVVPAALALLVVAHADAAGQLLLRNVLLGVAVAQSLLVFAQAAVGSILLYADDYATNYWFKPEKFTRWMGTTDSPLVLTVLLGVAAALALGVRSIVLRFGMLLMFGAAILITQSRVGGLVMGVILVLAIFRTRLSLIARVLTTGILGIAVYVVGTSPLAGGLLNRLQDDTGSSTARELAINYVFNNLSHYLFSGGGLTSSYEVARLAGLQTSIESSMLMYAIDVGVIIAVVYFGAQLIVMVRYGPDGWIPGVTLAGYVALVLVNASSALAFANLTGSLTWVVLALVMAGAAPSAAAQAVGAPASARALASVAS
jgi:hypothetical protein